MGTLRAITLLLWLSLLFVLLIELFLFLLLLLLIIIFFSAISILFSELLLLLLLRVLLELLLFTFLIRHRYRQIHINIDRHGRFAAFTVWRATVAVWVICYCSDLLFLAALRCLFSAWLFRYLDEALVIRCALWRRTIHCLRNLLCWFRLALLALFFVMLLRRTIICWRI